MFRTTQPRRGATSAPLRRRVVGAIAALTLGVSVLSGCAAGQIAQSVDQVPNQDGAEGTVGELGVRNLLIAGPATAPDHGSGIALTKGSSAELRFWLTNDSSTASDTLTAISTPAGTVSISGDATVEPQGFLKVGTDDATVTATISQLSEPVKYGVSIPFTFSFAQAGDVSMNATVSIPQERGESRATTDIYPAEPTNIWGD